MGLTVALGNALQGLRTTETGLDTVSRNVANAGTAGYVRRSVQPVELAPYGVRDGVIRRALDTVVQRQLRRESAGGAYSATMAAYLSRLDSGFGVPGSEAALDTRFNAFAGALHALASEPGNRTARSEALAGARDMAATLNDLSDTVQGLRSDAEAEIASLTGEANAALRTIARIESQLPSMADGNARADLLDERDRQVDFLGEVLDIRVLKRGGDGIAIVTASGTALFDGQASQLGFDARGGIGPGSLYDPDPARSGVGQLRIVDPQGGGVDLTAGTMQTGRMAALLTLRDATLVTAQERLDAMAAGLARAMSDGPRQGVAVSAGGADGFDLDLSGLAAGNSFSLTVEDSAGQRSLSFVRVESAAALPLVAGAGPGGSVIGIDFSGGMAGVASQVQAALGSAFSVSAPGATSLRLLDDGAAGTSAITAASAAVTVTGVQDGRVELPLFVDAGNGTAFSVFTGAADGVPQQRGLAARIGLHPAVAADPSLLVRLAADTPAGDPTRPAALADRLDHAVMALPAFTGPGTAGRFTGTLGGFIRQELDVQAGEAQAAESADAGQQVVVNSLRERFAEASGVSVDEELAHLVELQNAYAANARIITVVRDMFDALMRI